VAHGEVQDLVGNYVGMWTNTTFNSTGRAEITITLAGTNATITFNMDGFVFGYVDPPVINMPGTVTTNFLENQIEINNKGVGVFGDIKGLIVSPYTDPCPTCPKPQFVSGPIFSRGEFSAILTNIPGGTFSNIIAVGTIANGQFTLNYTVNFNQPPSASNPAYGVMRCALPLTIRAVWGNQIFWVGGTGPYQAMLRTNLTTDTWTDVGTVTNGFSAIFPPMTRPMGFFRVKGK
jgi:hypothetical protein